MLIDVSTFCFVLGMVGNAIETRQVSDEFRNLLFLLVCVIPPLSCSILRTSPGKHLLGLTVLEWNEEGIGIKKALVRSSPWIFMASGLGLSGLIENDAIKYIRIGLLISFLGYYILNVFWIMSSFPGKTPVDYFTKSCVFVYPKLKKL